MSTITSFEDISNDYDPRKNTSRPIMSKYEKIKVIGIRTQQIAGGASTLATIPPGTTDPRAIAIAELEQKKLPFVIARVLPSGIKEYWKLKDMIILPD